MKKILVVALMTILSTAIVYTYYSLDINKKITVSDVHGSADFYTQKVQPIFDAKCIACHSCYNSPCQLDLSSFYSTVRGANSISIYDFPKLNSREPTRMFIDANSEKEWRDKGFFSILKQGQRSTSILSHMISGFKGIESGKQELYKSEETRVCISDSDESSLIAYEKANPAGRMPYGFPALSGNEVKLIEKWQESGMLGPDLDDQESALLSFTGTKSLIKEWEAFFNRKDLKSQLASRYIYEHLFLAHIYFSDYPKIIFRLVRSRTSKGRIAEISTVYPFDDPGKNYFYRLRPVVNTIMHKSHIPFEFNKQKMKKWDKDFYLSDWKVTSKTMPKYGREGSNPYKTFEDIPVKARYEFFLNESNYHIMTFIKGPVCRGQTALNVINDHFWVFFIDPKKDPLVNSKDLYKLVSEKMILPAKLSDDFEPLIDLRDNYWKTVRKKFEYLEGKKLDLNWIWNGERENSNSAISVMRHFDSAHVIKGLQGRIPKTIWVLDYHVFESIYYNLTSGYNVFGPMLHQLNSRLFMEISRVASEDFFLSFLPHGPRRKIRKEWNKEIPTKKESTLKWMSDLFTQDTSEKMKYKYIYDGKKIISNIKLPMLNTKEAFLEKIIKTRLDSGQVSGNKTKLSHVLKRLSQVKSKGIAFLPDSILLRFNEALYTLVHHKDHYNVSMLLFEDERRNIKNDTIDIIPGVVSSYPNLFIILDDNTINDFINRLEKAEGKEDISKILNAFGVSRSHENFWDIYKIFSDNTYEKSTNEFGQLDLNRYLNI